ncbi:VWA domain-containing protein [Ectobacillus panaciterrae]|uniref:VWA domain-containing protein n=1 Tax=Ectobacillus panaciterrae TaxID=363872 RepID=UPI003CCB94E1
MFWSFMEIGKFNKDLSKKRGFMNRLSSAFTSDFSFLEELNNMGGRLLDNASFFSVKDPASIREDEPYA